MPEPDGSDAERARELAVALRDLLTWAHDVVDPRTDNEVVALARDHLTTPGAQESVVSRAFSPFEHVNLQTAIDAWTAEQGRTVSTAGIAMPPHYGALSLQQLLTGEALPPISVTAPALVDLPNGPGTTLGCLKLALLLVTDARGRYVLLVNAAFEEEPRILLEVAGLPVPEAQAVLAELDALRSRLNVYRGQLLDVSINHMAGLALEFATFPPTPRSDVILPEAVLVRVERHALGVAEHRDALLAAGQHLKRGLLMFGPPGTGKTHTMRYLVTHMPGYTRLLLSGRSLHVVGAITELARELEPAVIVLEDVDLVAEDRSFGPDGSPVLFELLDAMDGAAPDADLLFLLTTNRADLLEPALAARPGRVDVAVEIDLPDAQARRQLLELYGRGVPLQLTEEDVTAAVDRMAGVTASFLKELLRRAVLEALRDDASLPAVTATHLNRALDDLLDSSQQVTRSLLGVGGDEDDPPAPAGPHPGPAPAMFSRRPLAYRRGAWWAGR